MSRLAREVVLTAQPADVRRTHPGPAVHVVTVASPEHRGQLRSLRDEDDGEVPVGGGAVLAVRDHSALAAAAWTAVEHGTSELVGVVTVEHERGRGLGGLVVEAAVTSAAEAGADLLWLRTHDAPALRLYQELGFRLVDDAVVDRSGAG